MKLDDLTIAEIKTYIRKNSVNHNLIKILEKDERKGVKKIAKKCKDDLLKKEQKLMNWQKRNKRLQELRKDGLSLVAGVDEAGRGPIAGPVVAAAVILDINIKIIGLNDSKKISSRKREKIFKKIKECAVAIGIGIIKNDFIDQVNIHNATLFAMKRAIQNLDIIPEYLLIDGNHCVDGIKIPQETIIGGDASVNNIAAASIMAKVTRDHIIDKYHSQFPQYGFKNHKGYCTREHINALKKHGPTPIHRYSYSIVREAEQGFKKSEQINLFN